MDGANDDASPMVGSDAVNKGGMVRWRSSISLVSPGTSIMLVVVVVVVIVLVTSSILIILLEEDNWLGVSRAVVVVVVVLVVVVSLGYTGTTRGGIPVKVATKVSGSVL